MLLSYYGRTNVGIQNGSEAANMESKDTLAFIVDCMWTVVLLQMQDSKNFGWEINGDINFNWKTLLENKVMFKSLPWLWACSPQLLTLKEYHIAQGPNFFFFSSD